MNLSQWHIGGGKICEELTNVKRREISRVLGGISNSDDDDNNNDNKWKTCRVSQLKRKGENVRIDIYDKGRR